jgi:hypothetical protein
VSSNKPDKLSSQEAKVIEALRKFKSRRLRNRVWEVAKFRLFAAFHPIEPWITGAMATMLALVICHQLQ